MSRQIRRVRPTLYSSIDDQVKRALRQAGVNSLKNSVANLSRAQVSITKVVETSDAVAVEEETSTEAVVGYDYSTDPATADADYGSISDRVDNLDDYLVGTLQTLLDSMQSQIDSQASASAAWYTLQYIPSGIITQITLPYTPIDVRVFKNGLRLYSGLAYDYTVSGDIVYVNGISGDRFVIDYSSNGAGS